MKILISEDIDAKYEKIKKVIDDNFDDISFNRSKQTNNTIRELMTNQYDLLIQDMQLPNTHNGSIDTKGGINVLNQINYRNIDIPVIICSSILVRKELDSYSYTNIPSTFFSSSSSIWKKDLIDFINNNKVLS
jgi:CheY-like chemotaxis protein